MMSRCVRSWSSSILGLALCLTAGSVSSQSGVSKPAAHRFIGATFSGGGKIMIVDADGKTEWEINAMNCLDVSMLPNGNVLYVSRGGEKRPGLGAVEVNRKKEVVWQYKLETETYSVERLSNGNTLIGDNNNFRVIEVDKDGKIEKEVKITTKAPPHTGIRSARKLASGNYLVAQRADGVVREYDATGAIVWEYKVSAPMVAVRLPNGNTLINTANKGLLVEVNKAGKKVWKITAEDIPSDLKPGSGSGRGVGVQRLPNGNTVASFEGAIYEFTPDKKIIWSRRDGFLKGLMAFQILDVPDK